MNSHPWSKGIGRFLGWRLNACALVVMMALLPSLWLGFSTLHGSGLKDAWSGPFLGALWRSLALSSAVLVIALALGWPLGTLMGLARFPGRRLFLAALVVPLFTPATLWAIGLSSARSLLPYRHRWWFDGFSGALLTGIVQALPLVIVATLLAVRTLPAAPIEAARLAGGLRSLALASVRFSLAAGLAAAGLGALMAIADPGPAQIMGYHGVASEVLIAFSANYDSAQAAGKAIVMTLLLLPMLMPLAWIISRWSQAHLLGRDLRSASASRGVLSAGGWIWPGVGICLLLLLLPVVGLLPPLRSSQTPESFAYAWNLLKGSAGATLRVGITAAVLSTCLGVVFHLAAGRERAGRLALLLVCFLILSVPPSVHALGFASLAAQLPAAFDSVTRQDFAVGLAAGLRWLPMPALFCLMASARLPESCHDSAVLHGVPALRYHWKVSLPCVLPAMLASFLLVALATVADVSSTLLLQPPGTATFTTRIFSIIDSTTQRTLSVLCLVHIGSGLLLICLGSILLGRWHRRITH